MKKLTLSSGVILIVLVAFLNSARTINAKSNQTLPNQQGDGGAKHSETAQQGQIEPTVPSAVYEATESALLEALRTIRAQQETAAKQIHAQYEPWYAPAVFAQIALCVIGAVYSFFAWKQWAPMNTQAKIANASLSQSAKAADAAAKSAQVAEQSLYDLERPWIFIRISKSEGFSRKAPTSLEPIMWTSIGWYVQNFGRNPGFVTESAIRIRISPVPIPETPDYGMERHPAITLAVPLPQGVPHENWTTFDEHRKLMRGEALFLFYGFIKYRDTFGRDHESSWCAVMQIPKLIMSGQPDGYWVFGGPSAYTKYT